MRDRRAIDILEDLWRDHPLAFPLWVFGLGVLGFVAQRLLGVWFWFYGSLTIVMIIGGAVLLPVGILITVRRQRNVIVLTCPNCGLESRTAERPFKVVRPPGVAYIYAECSRCETPIYLDRYARWT